MYYVFNQSNIGYSHIKNKKPCQDFSATYKDNERTIVTCCDGHGGDVYIRSNIGSHNASNAVINVFNLLSFYEITRENEEELTKKIKLNLLCEWNKLVEEQLGNKPIRRNECEGLTDDEIDALKDNPVRAFGTTLTGAMVIRNKLLVVGIGDTEVIGIRSGKIIRLLESEDDPAANVTYSMCQENAYKHLRVRILDWHDFDGIILCTDGLSSPYQSYENFENSFIKPIVFKTLETDGMSHISEFVDNIASKLGVGDDVSLSFILKGSTIKKYYK